MSDKTVIQKWIIAGLLILHIAWIGNHMRLVAGGQINPWRLGGYAMYTVPSLVSRMQVFDIKFPDAPIRVNRTRYELATRFTNASRTFRCADVPARALLAFFDENRGLIGSNLVFVYSDREFVRNPPSTKRVMSGSVVLAWQGITGFTYTSRFCGNEHTGSVTLPVGISSALP